MSLQGLVLNSMVENSTMISKGTLVHKSEAFAYVLANECHGQRCDFCLKRNDKLRKCRDCAYMSYCDKDCEVNDWITGHKYECLNIRTYVIRNVIPSDFHFVLLMSRIILKLKLDGGKEREEVVGSVVRRFKDLQSEGENIKSNAARVQSVIKYAIVLMELLPLEDLPSFSEILEIYGKCFANASVIRDDEYNIVGSAVYLGTSIFDHSCQPNAVLVSEGTASCAYTIEDIPVLDYSKIFVSYINLQSTTQERRKELKKGYYFDCNCVKCLDIQSDRLLNSMKCANPNCDAPVIVTEVPTSCLRCNTPLNTDVIQSSIAAKELCQKSLPELKTAMKLNLHFALNESVNILASTVCVLHPKNIHYFRIAYVAYDACVRLTYYSRAFKLLDEIVIPFLKNCGNIYCPRIGILLLKIGKCADLIDNYVVARKYLHEGFDILNVTHGVSDKGLMVYRALLSTVEYGVAVQACDDLMPCTEESLTMREPIQCLPPTSPKYDLHDVRSDLAPAYDTGLEPHYLRHEHLTVIPPVTQNPYVSSLDQWLSNKPAIRITDWSGVDINLSAIDVMHIVKSLQRDGCEYNMSRFLGRTTLLTLTNRFFADKDNTFKTSLICRKISKEVIIIAQKDNPLVVGLVSGIFLKLTAISGDCMLCE